MARQPCGWMSSWDTPCWRIPATLGIRLAGVTQLPLGYALLAIRLAGVAYPRGMPGACQGCSMDGVPWIRACGSSCDTRSMRGGPEHPERSYRHAHRLAREGGRVPSHPRTQVTPRLCASCAVLAASWPQPEPVVHGAWGYTPPALCRGLGGSRDLGVSLGADGADGHDALRARLRDVDVEQLHTPQTAAGESSNTALCC